MLEACGNQCGARDFRIDLAHWRPDRAGRLAISPSSRHAAGSLLWFDAFLVAGVDTVRSVGRISHAPC
jgi:hypothetical protein